MKTKIEWIDFLKGLAIFAVVLDHLFFVISYSKTLHLFTIYSVTLFIFLSGVTSIISIERNKKPLKEYQLKRVKSILVPYLFATIIYTITNLNYRFNLEAFWSNIIHFNAAAPFYFVLFYCQLILIAPFLYRILARKKIVFQLLSLIPIYLISRYLTHYTEISGVYGGGGRILGGSYLFVFYLGMLFFLIYQKYSEKINRIWLHLFGCILSISLLYVIYSSGWLNIAWSNPPNKQAILYTLLVLLLGYSIFMILAKWRLTNIFLSIFMIMGKYSLYIFLYHMLAIFYVSKSIVALGLSNNIILAVLYISCAIIIPILIGIITKYYTKIKMNERILNWVIDQPKGKLGSTRSDIAN